MLPRCRGRRRWFAAVSVATLLTLVLPIGLGIALVGCSDGGKATSRGATQGTSASASRAEAAWRPESEATVSVIPANAIAVIDGDTAVFRLTDGTQEEVRLIGIDAPELNVQRDVYGMESAKRAAVQLRSQSRVFLEKGPKERDRYGRLLAYVWFVEPNTRPSAADIRNGMLNAKMLISGYAKQYTKQPNARYSELFGIFAEQARTEKRGLWSSKLLKIAGPNSSWNPVPASKATVTSFPYVGNLTSRKFHKAACKNAKKMRLANRVQFESREEAISSEYVPCGICKP